MPNVPISRAIVKSCWALLQLRCICQRSMPSHQLMLRLASVHFSAIPSCWNHLRSARVAVVAWVPPS